MSVSFKFKMAVFAAVCALAVSISACTREPAAFEIRLMIWGTPDEVKTVNDYVKVFHEKHPDVKVTIQHTPDMGFREKLNTRFLGGDPPDVFYLAFEDLPGVASHGWLLPIDELVERDQKAGTFDPKSYYLGAYEDFRFEGKLYGVVKDFATLVCYYNKDLFDKYDVPRPRAGWTWDEFLDDCHKLTHAGEGASGEYGFVLETWTGEIFPWVWQNGGEFCTGDPPRWVLGEEPYLTKNAQALQFLADLMWKEGVAPNPSITRDQGTKDLFKTGKIGMCTYGRWECMDLKSVKDFEWDVAELPKREKKACTLFPVCYAIAKETKHKEAAWELVKYLTGEEGQIATAESGHAIPSMIKIAESKHFFESSALAGLHVDAKPNVTSIEFCRAAPDLLCWQEVRERMSRGLEGLWNGTQRDARAVLVALQPELQAIVAEEPARRKKARSLRGE